MRQRGLADARHVLDEQVPASKKRDEGKLDHLVLAANHALDGLSQPGEELGGNGGLVVYAGLFHVSGVAGGPAASLDSDRPIWYFLYRTGRLTSRKSGTSTRMKSQLRSRYRHAS